jgi:uncharacterized protein (TIGR01777 family)
VKIVVAGGTGWLGSALCPALASDGHEVVILTRSPRAPTRGTRYVAWDGRTLAGWSAEVDGAGAVVNLAGEPIAPKRWTPARKAVLRASRIDATRALVQAIEQAVVPPTVLANVSGVGYYGDRGDATITELDPAGDDFLAQLVVEWEAAAQTHAARVALMRTGVVLGPGGGALEPLALPFRFFVGGPIGSGRQWIPWIHREDVVRAISFILSDSRLGGPINVTSPNPVRNGDLARTLGIVLRRPSWIPVPGFALKHLFGELAITLLGSQRAIPACLSNAGFRFQYPDLLPALRQALGARS